MRRRKWFRRIRRRIRIPTSRRRRSDSGVPPAILHWKNSKRAEQVLETLRSFDGPNLVPRVLVYLRKIDPFVFEEVLLSALHESGHAIERNRRYTGDGGVDGRIWDKEEQEILLQAKRYTSYVKPEDVIAFSELVADSDAAYGVFVHTGRTGPATREKKSKDVTIISGNHLVRLLLHPADTWLRPPSS